MSGKHRTGAGADGGGPQRTSAAAEQAAEPWNVDWAAERAADALRYLGKNYPECQGALRALDAHEQAAMRGDRGAYLAALRAYCRAGRDEALRIRRGAA